MSSNAPSSSNEDTRGAAAAPLLPGAAGLETMASPAVRTMMDTDDASLLDEESAIKALTENVRSQDDLERDITHQAELALIDAEDKRDEKRIEKLASSKAKLEGQRQTYQQRLRATSAGNPSLRRRFETEIAKLGAEIELANKDLDDFRQRIDQRHLHTEDGGAGPNSTADDPEKGAGSLRLPNETHRDFLIRTGKITPFAKVGGARPEGVQGSLADVILEAEDEAVAEELTERARDEPRSHQDLRLPGFTEGAPSAGPSAAAESEFSLRPRKKRKPRPTELEDGSDYGDGGDEDEWKPPLGSSDLGTAPASDDDVQEDETDFTERTRPAPRKQKRQKARIASETEGESDGKVSLSGVDDGNETVYKQRLEDWVARRSNARSLRQESRHHPPEDDSDTKLEWFKPSPDEPDHVFENGLRLPGDIYPSLFAYQKTAVRWLAELYDMRVGGIIGDEMGLGKTGMLSLRHHFHVY